MIKYIKNYLTTRKQRSIVVKRIKGLLTLKYKGVY